MNQLLRDDRGISLIEFVLSMALFAVITIPVFSIYAGAGLLMQKSKENIQVAAIERQIKAEVTKAAEELKNGSSDDPQLHKYPSGKQSLPTKQSPVKSNYGVLQYDYNQIDNRYKYTLHYIEKKLTESPPPGLTTEKTQIYEKDDLNNIGAMRFMIEIFKTEDPEQQPNPTFKSVKTFFIETHYNSPTAP